MEQCIYLYFFFFYRISNFNRNGHDGPRHRRSQDAAGVFWNLLRHVLTEGRCQLTQHTHLKLNTQTQHTRSWTQRIFRKFTIKFSCWSDWKVSLKFRKSHRMSLGDLYFWSRGTAWHGMEDQILLYLNKQTNKIKEINGTKNVDANKLDRHLVWKKWKKNNKQN